MKIAALQRSASIDNANGAEILSNKPLAPQAALLAIVMLSLTSWAVVVGLVWLLSATSAWPGDAPNLEHVPKSCQQLHRWQERCRLGPCNVKKIEEWREQCKKDSTADRE